MLNNISFYDLQKKIYYITVIMLNNLYTFDDD